MTDESKGEQHTAAIRQAQRSYAESLAFSAAYKAMKDAAQHMLEQFAKMSLSQEMGVELVHTALVAVGAGMRELAIEHLHAPVKNVDDCEARARALGAKIYREQWAVMTKPVGADIALVSKDGLAKPTGTGLVGLDGKAL